MSKPRTTPLPVPSDGGDALDFRAAMRDVRPLKNAPVEAIPKPRPRRRMRPPAPQPADLEALMPLVTAAPADAAAGADALKFQRPGVRTAVLRRLQRGLIPIEDELDLHGMSQTQARDHLAEFLEQSRAAGIRCVRLIHGKGYRSGARGPVLKIAVDTWLRRHSQVLAFASARAIDGGTGAVYVLLRA